MKWILPILLVAVVPATAHAATPALLAEAVDKWIGERNQWAFNQFVREFDGDTVREERLERYDPSQAGERRWQLLSVNGRPPGAERRTEWQERKRKKRLNLGKSLGVFFDFELAAVVQGNASNVRYRVPLRNEHSWLFPMDRVNVVVTVNQTTRAIDQIEAGIDEPFRVALGLGQVMGIDFDVQMNPSVRQGETDNPRAAKPDGIATAVVKKLGERVEYAWSEFKRVTPHPDNAVVAVPKT